jgi:excisionase family DNA binding protein
VAILVGVVTMGDYLTADQVAQVAGVRHTTVCRWLATGRLKGQKVENAWRIRRRDVERFLARRSLGTPSPSP